MALTFDQANATTTPDTSGIAGLSSQQTPPLTLEGLYQNVLGRASDPGGRSFWSPLFGETIDPNEIEMFVNRAQAEKSGAFYDPTKTFAPPSPLDKTKIPGLVESAYQNVLGRGADVSGKEFYSKQLETGQMTEDQLRQALAYGSRSLADQLAAQKALGQEIFGKEEDLRSKFSTDVTKTIQDVLGEQKDISELEKALGVEAGTYSSYLTPSRLEKAGSVEDIRQQIQPLNKVQEAARTAGIVKNLYGLPEDQVSPLVTGLAQGKSEDPLIKELYNALLEGKPTSDIQSKLIQDAAKKNPESQFFKDNPNARQIYTPIDKEISIDKGSGQYGTVNGLPLLNKKVADEDVLGNKVIRGLDKEFRENFKGAEKLGADIESDYAGRFARGVGVFGVNAGTDDINEFDRLEKQIEKYGGIKTISDGEGGVTEYVEVPTESGEARRVSLPDLFDTGGEFGYNGADRYKLYKDTKATLDELSTENKLDPRSFKSTKEQFESLNDKYKDLYTWQGRTQSLQLTPEQAKALGIEYDPNDSKTHAQIIYKAQGDKLVPVKVQKSFQFQDPNTSRGFIGDLLGSFMEILSVPPIAMALGMAGGLPSLLSGNLVTGMTYGAWSPQLAGAMSSSIFNPSAIGASLGPTFGITDLAQQKLLGTAVLNAGLSGLTTGAATGDLSKAGLAALAAGTGTGAQGLTAPLVGENLSRMIGSAASAKVLDKDIGEALKSQLLSTGLGGLLDSAGLDKAGSNVLAALMPAIITGEINPSDIIRLTQALDKQGK